MTHEQVDNSAPRKSIARKVLWTGGAIVGAIAINAGFLWLLSYINEHELPEQKPKARLTLAPPPEPPPREDKPNPEPENKPEPKPQPEKPEAQTLPEVKAPVPSPKPPEPAPVPLDLSAATMSAVRTATPVTPPPETPSTRKTQGDGSSPGGPVTVDKLDQPLRWLERPDYYPSEARRVGAEGRVIVKLLVGKDGRVERANITDVVGHESFRTAVADFIDRWRAAVPKHNGEPVRVRVNKRIRFELN